MTIAEMHTWFRQYAQQMGMQNVRAILPEQIDTLINTAIKDTIDEIIRLNVGTTNDRVITDNAKLANINALRTLYKVKTITIKGKKLSEYLNNAEEIKSSDYFPTSADKPLYYVDFSIRYADRNLNVQVAPIISGNESSSENDGASDPNAMASVEPNYTRWFPVRIVDDSYLADILNDWVLSPRLRTPVMVIYADGTTGAGVEDSIFEVYVGENAEESLRAIAATKWFGQLRCSYIKRPKEVRYVSDVTGNLADNIDSDLPVQLHIPMLKHAVDLYRASITGNLFAAQEQQQQQQREGVRNQARPDNEGYQS